MSKRIKFYSGILIILSFVNAILSTVFLKSLAEIVDSLNNNTFTFNLIIISFIFLIIKLLFLLSYYLFNSYVKRIFILDVRNNYFDNNYFNIAKGYDDIFIEKELSILINDVDVYYSYFSNKLSIINTTIYIITYFISLAFVNYYLAFSLIALVMITSLLSNKSNANYSKYRNKYQEKIAEYNKNEKEFIESRSLFTTNIGYKLMEQIEKSNKELSEGLYKYGCIRTNIVTTSFLLSNLSLIILIFIIFIISNSITLLYGTLLLAFEYYEICLYSIKGLIVNLSDIKSRKNIVLKFNEKHNIRINKPIKDFNEITLRDIKINNLIYNFRLKKHDKILIVGKTGSGKTTLFNILSDEVSYDGNYLIDNENISLVDIDDLIYRCNSKTTVFETNFLNNVSFFSLNNVDISLIKEILTKINMQYLFDKDNCTILSDGEKQITLFLRALFQREKILLLDEIFSNVNPQIKELLISYFPKNKTIIITDHHKIDSYNNFKTININEICMTS